MKEKLIFGAVLVAVSVLLASVFIRPVQNVTNSVTQGSTSTLDGVDNPYVSIGGVREWHGRVPMTASSSVICSIPNPFSATSTVQFPIRLTIQGNGLGAQTIYVSTSTTNAASSTVALTGGLATGAGQATFVVVGNMATSTSATVPNSTGDANILPGATLQGTSNYILAPTDRLNVRIASSTPGVFASYFTGACAAVIDKTN